MATTICKGHGPLKNCFDRPDRFRLNFHTVRPIGGPTLSM